MNSFEFNKIAGAVLGTALVVFGLNELAAAVYHAEKPEKQGYKIEVAAVDAGEVAGGAETPAVSLGTLLASADATKGAGVFKNCAGCHDPAKGGSNKQGPNLWGIVGRNHASLSGYAYSEDMKAKASEPWTYEALNEFLKAPKAVFPKTKMAYGGVKKDQERANLMAYLATLSDSPVPFPAP
jgi:cytochrome c